MKCKYCGEETNLVLRPDTPHEGELRCVSCDRHNKWVRKPKNEGKRADKNDKWRAMHKEKGFGCGFCGATEAEFPNSGQWHVDHIIQLCDGGQDCFENTMMLDVFCHTTKNAEQARRKAILKSKEVAKCQSTSSTPW